MSDFLKFNGYVGSVRYSNEDEVFHGKLEGIRDLITYEGTDVATLKSAFHEPVADYIQTCHNNKREPKLPFKGSFNVRVGPDLQKRAAVYAADHGKRLNSVVAEALEKYLELVEC